MAKFSLNEQVYSGYSQAQKFKIWEDLYEFFDKAPNNYPVEKWQFGDLDLWPVIKGLIMLRAARVFHNQQSELIQFSEAEDPNNWLIQPEVKPTGKGFSFFKKKSSAKATHTIASTRKHARELLENRSRLVNSLPNNHSDVLFFGLNMTTAKFGDLSVQYLFDPIRVELAEQGLSSYCYMLDGQKDAVEDLDYLIRGVGPFADEFAQCQSVFAPDHQVDFSQLEKFEEFWLAGTRIFPLGYLVTLKTFNNVYSRLYSCRRALYQFFKFRQTKAVVLSAYYGIFGWAASAAAKALNIPVVDVQHGVAGVAHESYSFQGLPESGYNTLPTHFFCWTKDDAEALNNHANGTFKALHSGQCWKLTDELINRHEDTLILSGKRMEEARIGLCDYRQTLIFDKAQRNADVENEEHQTLILVAVQDEAELDMLQELLRHVPKKYHFLTRLHPSMMRNDTTALERKYRSLNLGVSSRAPLNLLLSFCDCVLTRYSSTILDGESFGAQGISWGANDAAAGKWYFNWRKEDSVVYCGDNNISFYKLFNEKLSSLKADYNVPSHSPLLHDSVAEFVKDVLQNAR